MVRADEACAMFNQHCEAAGWPMRSDPTLAFEATTLKEAVSVWRAAAGNRTWPPRSALTPRAMKGFLTEVAVVDVVVFCSRVRYRPRLSGTQLERVLLRADGSFLDEVVPEPFLSRWQAMLKLCLDVGGPIRTVSRLEFRQQNYLRIETFFAPLGQAETAPDAILVVANAASARLAMARELHN